MKIVVGSDHAGFEHKTKISELIRSLGHDVIDVGTGGTGSVDYPDYGEKGAMEVSCGRAELGVLICGTGIGICMAASKVRGIRGAVCWNEETARLARQHNNANVLCLGARFISIEDALKITRVFIKTPTSKDARHVRRVGKIAIIEERSKPCDCR